MLLLALDTSTSAITAALHDGSRVLADYTVVNARAHGERLAPGIRHVLRASSADPGDVTDVVVGLGPGPFTGLRVGVVSARMTALATGAALHGLCSLDVLAFDASRTGAHEELLVATDARRKEVYWARYRGAPQPREGRDGIRAGAGRRPVPAPQRVDGPAVARPADLPEEVRALPTVGRGPVLYPGLFPHGSSPLDVSAAALADLAVHRLSAGDRLEAGEPIYLRRPDVAPAPPAKAALG